MKPFSSKPTASKLTGSSFSSTTTELKVVVVGAGGVGKSTLTVQFVQGVFLEEYDPTIEDSYRKAYVLPDGKSVLFDVLDTAGCDEFSAMSEVWHRSGEAFMIVYSITDRASFTEAESFYERASRMKDATDFPCILVGNKADLGCNREVSRKDGEELARRLGIEFYESCAKERAETEPAFEMLAQKAMEKREANVATRKEKKKRKMCVVM